MKNPWKRKERVCFSSVFFFLFSPDLYYYYYYLFGQNLIALIVLSLLNQAGKKR